MAYKSYNLISNYLRRHSSCADFFYPTIGNYRKILIRRIQKNQDRFCGPGQNLHFLKFKLHLAGVFFVVANRHCSF